jgi:hypothetical protein
MSTNKEFGIDPEDFLYYVIKPTLYKLGKPLESERAEKILLGTAVYESNLRFLRQIDNGPAISPFQIEPNTANVIWNKVINRSNELIELYENIYQNLSSLVINGIDRTDQLHANLYLACAIARLVYWFDPELLPTSIEDMGAYYKRVYNTAGGKGTAAGWIASYKKVAYVYSAVD